MFFLESNHRRPDRRFLWKEYCGCRAGSGDWRQTMADAPKRLSNPVKADEDEIANSALRYRTLFDLVPVAVYMTDAAGIVQEYNHRAIEMWGRTPGSNEKFCGSFRMYYPDGTFMPHDQCPMARVLRGEELEPSELEVIVAQENGAKLKVAVAPRTLKDDEGNILGAINCVHDITHRKLAEIDFGGGAPGGEGAGRRLGGVGGFGRAGPCPR